MTFRLESAAWKAVYRLAGARPSSAPYLSGDTFRSLCDHFYESGTTRDFDPERVRTGDLVFCDGHRLAEFLSGPARIIKNTFSIISHNSDLNVDASIVRLFPRSVNRLFAQNAVISHERVEPLPIGLENKKLHYNGVTRDYDFLRERTPKKKPRILSAFTIGNNPAVRSTAAEVLSQSPLNDFLERVNSRSYRRIAAEYMFIASPPGNGEDCHRTWEAMYLRSVPVVLRSPLTEAFQSRGLPMLVVDSYREVAAAGEKSLREIYSRMCPLMDAEPLWFDYWKQRIQRLATWES